MNVECASTRYLDQWDAVNLTTVSPAETFTTLSGSPAPSARIAFVTNRDGNSEIYVMDIDGTNQVRLTNTSYEEMYPAWSPDRTKIAFVSFVPDHLGTENKSIVVMNANGTGVKVLTFTTFDLHPTWALDGRIAFSRYVGEPKNYDIFVMDGDGFNAHPIMYEDGRDDEPSWSPDGTKIAFVGTRDGYSEVFVMNADGGGRTPLTQDSVMVRSPRWSPDGTRIAYNRSYATDLGIERDGLPQLRSRVLWELRPDPAERANPLAERPQSDRLHELPTASGRYCPHRVEFKHRSQ